MLPFLLQSDGFIIPTYLVVNSLVFCLGTYWVYLRAKNLALDEDAALDLCLACMIGSFVGARLLHVLVEAPRFYVHHPAMIFKFWYGGFVYYGGLALGLIATWGLCRFRRYPFFAYADVFSLPLAAGYALGRVGCLAAGCCYGLAAPHLPWAVTFGPGVEAPAGLKLHPTQIYSSLWELTVLGILFVLERRWRLRPYQDRQSGTLFATWITLHGLGRGVIEQFRGDFRGPTLLDLSISTWLSLVAMCWGIWLLYSKRG